MTKPVAYIATLACEGCELFGHGATERSALAALDSAIFQLGHEMGWPDGWYAAELAEQVKLQPVILGSAWQDSRQLEGLSAKDEARARIA